MPAARHSRNKPYDKALFVDACDWIASGKSLRSWCRQAGHPSHTTISNWAAANPRLAALLEASRQTQAEVWADELVEIADGPTRQIEERDAAAAAKTEDPVARDRLRVDTRKWLVARLLASRYGDKIDVTSGNEPIQRGVMDEDAVLAAAAAIERKRAADKDQPES